MREFDEVAVFPDLAQASVSFAFDVSQFDPEDNSQRSAFRLVALSKHLKSQAERARKRGGEEAEAQSLHAQLIEPVRSFLDDVTNGPPGVNGRPLLMLASSDEANRAVTLARQKKWDYEFEGEKTWLSVETPKVEMLLRDSFCAFESGRFYYVMCLIHSGAKPGLDEYALVQLQQLALEPERADKESYLAFKWGRKSYSLIGLANARLKALHKAAAPGHLNAVPALLRPFGLMGRKELTVAPKKLASMCVGVEDEKLQRAAEYVQARLDEKRERNPAKPPKVAALEKDWRERCAKRRISAKRIHRDPKNPIQRDMLAIAGLATGVPDFPFQDESEVHDSTRATAHSVESALYTHPRFMFEVGRSWRSFREALDALGNCPYLYLTWMVTVHDEQTVAEMERKLENLIYDPEGVRDKLKWPHRARAKPLTDVAELLASASHPLGQRTDVLKRNLKQRFDIFSWESIHHCGNMFRYPKETAALDAVRQAMGTTRRFDEVHTTLEQIRELVDDVSTLAGAYASRRTSRLAFVIATLGLLISINQITEMMEGENGGSKLLIAVTFALAIGLLYFVRVGGGSLLRRAWDQLSRSRKSS